MKSIVTKAMKMQNPNNTKLLVSLVSIALLQMSGQIGNVWAQSTPATPTAAPAAEAAKTAVEEKDKSALSLDAIVVTGTPQGVSKMKSAFRFPP